MKKYIIWIILAFGIIVGSIYFLNKNNNTSHEENYNSARTSQNIANESNSTDNNIDAEDSKKDEPKEENPKEESPKEESPKESKTNKETEIASFTTKIYTKDSGRQNNLSIACSTLNDTTVESGKTFSFSKTVGKATSGKGYKKADVFRDGDVIEALGGGLCQVSTTLYNAVLKIPELKVTERHPHSNKVPYIKSGKDAAVSFGAQDFKFVNNTGNTIKIKASNTKNNVTVKLIKIE